MFDVLIAGGDVYDGTGGETVRAAVGVLGDRVAAGGQDAGRRAGEQLSAMAWPPAPPSRRRGLRRG
jgi:hypothetical protein